MIRCLAYANSFVLAAVMLLPTAQAQQVSATPPDTAIDCQMLARMPNAPMTVDTCQKRMASHTAMMSALETPGGERAGDDRLTCNAITAEMKTLKVGGVTAANAAAGEAAGQDVMAIMQRAMAESMGMMATQTARSAAVAALPGNAAGHAAATANMAEQKAMQDRVTAEMSPARDRLETANTNSMGDLAKAMRANPRFARLMKLALERNCSG